MSWQDIVYALGTVFLGLALVPAIRSKTEKPPITTSLVSCVALSIMAFTAGTLHLWATSAMIMLEVVGYLTLVVQKIIERHEASKLLWDIDSYGKIREWGK